MAAQTLQHEFEQDDRIMLELNRAAALVLQEQWNDAQVLEEENYVKQVVGAEEERQIRIIGGFLGTQ